MTLLREHAYYLDRLGRVHGPMKWYSDKLGDRFEDQDGDVYSADGSNQHDSQLDLLTECDRHGNPRREEKSCPACRGTGEGDAGHCPCAECGGTGIRDLTINPVDSTPWFLNEKGICPVEPDVLVDVMFNGNMGEWGRADGFDWSLTNRALRITSYRLHVAEEALRRPHLIDGEFQSDKYPTCPRGKVPLSVKDKSAQDLLWEYAQRRRLVDAEFSADLEEALRIAGFVKPPENIQILYNSAEEAPPAAVDAKCQKATPQTYGVIDEIAGERARQISQEGWTLEHDDEHRYGELAAAASVYALRGSISDTDIEGSIRGCHPYGRSNVEVANAIEAFWPWDEEWWKPTNARRDLVKAAALIVAEIERLDRADAMLKAREGK